MNHDLGMALDLGRILLVIAAITSTSFQFLYMFTPWYKSPLGRAVMLQAIALCFALQLQVVFTFFVQDIPLNVLYWINDGILLVIVIATSMLAYLQWTYRRKRKEDHAVSDTTPLVSNKFYDVLKPITTVVLPGLSTLYFTLAAIWGSDVFPAAEQVVGTIAAINVFLGAFVQISSRSYNRSDAKYAGDIVVTNQPDGKKTYQLQLNDLPHDFDQRSELTFKIV